MHRRLSYAEKGKGPVEPPLPPRTARVRIPSFDTSELIRKHALTLVGRLTNPKVSKSGPSYLPLWPLEVRISTYRCRLGPRLLPIPVCVRKRSLESSGKPTISHWMIIIQRWEPSFSPTFPSQIPFWIQVQGVPLHLWSEQTLSCIAHDIGTLDYSEITNTVARMRVYIFY